MPPSEAHLTVQFAQLWYGKKNVHGQAKSSTHCVGFSTSMSMYWMINTKIYNIYMYIHMHTSKQFCSITHFPESNPVFYGCFCTPSTGSLHKSHNGAMWNVGFPAQQIPGLRNAGKAKLWPDGKIGSQYEPGSVVGRNTVSIHINTPQHAYIYNYIHMCSMYTINMCIYIYTCMYSTIHIQLYYISICIIMYMSIYINPYIYIYIIINNQKNTCV